MKHKYAGGCEHVHTHADKDPVDNHTCHCSVCKRVTGQDSTHVVFFRYGDLKVDNLAGLKRQPFNDRNPDGPPPRQFSTVHGLIGSNDGLIYVADRRGNRVQVFTQAGEFVAERTVAPRTLASGSAFVIAFSPDPEQRWLYLADGTNHKVWVLRRADLEIVGEFGRGGRQLGQFLRPHGMSVDSRGNIYVGEASTGRRVQRFLVQ